MTLPRGLLPVLFLLLVTHLNQAAVGTSGDVRYDVNHVSQAVRQEVRAEIRAGLQEEVTRHLARIEAAQQQRDQSRFADLLTDLKELLLTYDTPGQGLPNQGQLNQGQLNKSQLNQGQLKQNGLQAPSATTGVPCPAMTTLSQRMENLTSSVMEWQKNGQHKHIHSCADLRLSGVSVSGVYTVRPRGLGPLRVYCDMTTQGGGWTVFQRRTNDSVDFYRGWLEYAQGFGSPSGSHWLGLRTLHHMTHTDRFALRVHLADFDGGYRHADYSFFAISSEVTKFRMDLGSYTGNAGDALDHSRDHRFSTKDVDNDNHPNEHCATRYTGGWWYNSCYRANLNGQYLSGLHHLNRGINWNQWRGDAYSLRETTMMIRPANFSP